MRIAGLGLDPSDSCYDAARPWYVPNWWTDSAECQCIYDQGRPIGEQCASFKGVAETMGGQVGGVLGGAVSGVGSGTLNATNIPGMMVLAAAVFAGILLLKR